MQTKINPKGYSKTIAFTLNDKVIAMLKDIAETNSSSMSYEIRRLIINEHIKISGSNQPDK
jgi:hypothetical protein